MIETKDDKTKQKTGGLLAASFLHFAFDVK
jgi:hypothetical protein